MRYILLAFCCFIFPTILYAQNLVPNPSFEEYTDCPTDQDEIFKVKEWTSYGNSSDYFNSCDKILYGEGFGVPSNLLGYQIPQKGEGYCGLYTYYPPEYREFIGTKLISSLIPQKKYFVSIKVSIANRSQCATNNIGILFSTKGYSETSPAPINNRAQIYSQSILSDSAQWNIISGSFIADSAYDYLIAGNFFKDDLTDTTELWWSQGNLCWSYYYIDDICVSDDSLECNLFNSVTNHFTNEEIDIYPNPALTKIFISSRENASIKIINILGEEVKSFSINRNINVNVSDLPIGLYFFIIKTNTNSFIKKQLIVH